MSDNTEQFLKSLTYSNEKIAAMKPDDLYLEYKLWCKQQGQQRIPRGDFETIIADDIFHWLQAREQRG